MREFSELVEGASRVHQGRWCMFDGSKCFQWSTERDNWYAEEIALFPVPPFMIIMTLLGRIRRGRRSEDDNEQVCGLMSKRYQYTNKFSSSGAVEVWKDAEDLNLEIEEVRFSFSFLVCFVVGAGIGGGGKKKKMQTTTNDDAKWRQQRFVDFENATTPVSRFAPSRDLV